MAWQVAVSGVCLALVAGVLLGAAIRTALPSSAGTSATAAPPGAVVAPSGAGESAVPPTGASLVPSTASSPSPAPPPARRFGVVAHLLWGDDAAAVACLDQLVAAGLGVVRFDVSWRNMEPAQGQVDGLARLDRLMGEIASRRMRAVITVIETPDWANGGRGPWTPPDDPTTYASFIGSLAARYAAQADVAWEVWNEPNDPRFWQPSPSPVAYARLLERASSAIRAAAPSAKVLGGSILYGDSAFLKAMYAAGAKGAFDGLAVHPYAQDRAPWDAGDPYHSFAGGLDRLRGAMVASGDGATPIWITEMGWQAGNGLDERTQAQYLAEAVAFVAVRPDIEVFAAYVFGPSAEAGFTLEATGAGSVAFSGYRDAVMAVPQAAR